MFSLCKNVLPFAVIDWVFPKVFDMFSGLLSLSLLGHLTREPIEPILRPRI
jgi:hypothetical protein